jgi:TatD DNase family protein
MPVELGQAIQNCQPAEFDPLAGAYYSVGIQEKDVISNLK